MRCIRVCNKSNHLFESRLQSLRNVAILFTQHMRISVLRRKAVANTHFSTFVTIYILYLVRLLVVVIYLIILYVSARQEISYFPLQNSFTAPYQHTDFLKVSNRGPSINFIHVQMKLNSRSCTSLNTCDRKAYIRR